MTHELCTILFFGLGVAVAAAGLILFGKYVAPWLREKQEWIRQQIGNEEYSYLVDQIKTFMAMAEQQLGAGHGKEKSELVIKWIKELFPNINADYVQALIDGFMKVLTKDGILNAK